MKPYEPERYNWQNWQQGARPPDLLYVKAVLFECPKLIGTKCTFIILNHSRFVDENIKIARRVQGKSHGHKRSHESRGALATSALVTGAAVLQGEEVLSLASEVGL